MKRRSDLLKFAAITGAVVTLSGCSVFRPVANFVDNSWPHVPKVKPVTTADATVSPTAIVDRRYAQAVTAIESRDYGTALESLQVARAASANDPRVLNALGVVYDKLGRFDLSSQYYDMAEKADPGSRVVAQNRRYSRMLQDGLTPDVAGVSLAQANPAERSDGPLDPKFVADRLYDHAARLLTSHDYDGALAVLQSAYAIRPGDARILNGLGVVYDLHGRFDLSSHYYDLAEKADPGSRVVAANRQFSLNLQHRGVKSSDLAVPIAVVTSSPQGQPPALQTQQDKFTARVQNLIQGGAA